MRFWRKKDNSAEVRVIEPEPDPLRLHIKRVPFSDGTAIALQVERRIVDGFGNVYWQEVSVVEEALQDTKSALDRRRVLAHPELIRLLRSMENIRYSTHFALLSTEAALCGEFKKAFHMDAERHDQSWESSKC